MAVANKDDPINQFDMTGTGGMMSRVYGMERRIEEIEERLDRIEREKRNRISKTSFKPSLDWG